MASKKKLAAVRKKSIKNGAKDKFLSTKADEMRRLPTEAEKVFRTILKENGINFKEQVPFVDKDGHRYIFDFLVMGKWVVEIDGGYHFTKEQKEKDNARDKVLKKVKFKIKRFTNYEVMNCTMKLQNWLNGIICGYKLKDADKIEYAIKESKRLDDEFTAICFDQFSYKTTFAINVYLDCKKFNKNLN